MTIEPFDDSIENVRKKLPFLINSIAVIQIRTLTFKTGRNDAFLYGSICVQQFKCIHFP